MGYVLRVNTLDGLHRLYDDMWHWQYEGRLTQLDVWMRVSLPREFVPNPDRPGYAHEVTMHYFRVDVPKKFWKHMQREQADRAVSDRYVNFEEETDAGMDQD